MIYISCGPVFALELFLPANARGLSCMHRMNEEQLDDELVPVVVRNSGQSPRLVQKKNRVTGICGNLRESAGINGNL